MRFEYLLFNVIIATSVGLARWWVPYPAKVWRVHAWLSIAIVAVPFVAWDAWVTGRHWWFNPQHILGWRWFGLPLEELAFFVTVPAACLFTWESLFARLGPGPAKASLASQGHTAHRRWTLVLGLLIGAGSAAWFGKEYTSAACLALAAAIAGDARSRARVWAQPNFALFLGLVVLFTAVFNGYLTARPIVLYDARFLLGFKLATIPGEDFLYGIALIAGTISLYEHAKLVDPRQPDPALVAKLHVLRDRLGKAWQLNRRIEARFGGYRHVAVRPDPTAPFRLADHSFHPSVAVIGSGLAGLRAATILQERGFAVEMFERNSYVGGKIGSWPIQLCTGETVAIEHGFHAFFGHYYNTNRFLHEIGVRSAFKSVDDYMIVDRHGRHLRYAAIARPPLLNLLSLLWHGHYRVRDVVFNPKLVGLTALLRYDRSATFARYDALSYAEFAAQIGLPASLRLAFNSFSRAFFAPPDRMSMAEMIKSFHFFFLSHDAGLLYDYPGEDYSTAILRPIVAHFERLGGVLHLNTAVDQLTRQSDETLLVNGRPFANVVLATDLPGAQKLLGTATPFGRHVPKLAQSLAQLEVTARYAVLRLWLNQPLSFIPSPVFWITDRLRCLDAIAFYSAYEPASATWARNHHGCVLELHSYCVPEDLADAAPVIEALVADLHDYLPELATATIVDRHLYMRRDFPAFGMGQHAHRPSTLTEVEGLVLAGDWLALPWPVMLMEAAVTSGIAAANVILAKHELALAPIDTVPLRGLLAQPRERPSVN